MNGEDFYKLVVKYNFAFANALFTLSHQKDILTKDQIDNLVKLLS